MATVDWEEDDWEVINDDGFVYKRKKRPRLDPATTTSAADPPPPDLAAEGRNRRERKRRALTKLREKYQREIDQWEHLSNMLRALKEKAENQQQLQWHEQTLMASSCDLAIDLPHPREKSSDTADRRLLDDLMLRAITEEAIIQEVSNLCDVAEAICKLQEERMKQSLIDLPVWASPRELISSLCDE
ncbi:hypothetical protein U1Q18_038291 [Sarracenia purpurea var. burkii]